MGGGEALLPPDLSERAAALRFVMIVLIVAFHAQPQGPEVGGVIGRLHYALFDVGARAGVPVLTALSGYFLFASGADRAPIALVRRKARTLLLPLLVWNVPVVIAVMAAQARGLGADDVAPLWPPAPWPMTDAALALARPAANYPLGFLRDLFVLAALAPLLGPIIRRAPSLSVATATAFFVVGPDTVILWREQMLTAFVIGGAVAVRPRWLRRLDGAGFWCGVAVFIGCLALGLPGQPEPLIVQTAALLAVPLLWSAFGALPGPARWALAGLAPASFFVFVAHAPLLAASWIVWRASDLPPTLHWIVGPVLTVSLLLAIYDFVLPRLPGSLVRLALGGRLSPIATGAPRRLG